MLVVDPLTTEAILGLDFLSSCSVDLVKHMLITGDGHVITLCSQNNHSRKTVPALSVRVGANVRIPSYSVMEIMADVTGSYKDNQVCVLEGIELQSNSVMVASAAIRAGVSVPMHVMNPTDQDITLYKGTRIATLTEAVDPDTSVQISSLQRTESVSAELETVFWQLVEGTTLSSQEQDKLFALLMEYADVFALKLVRISWARLICCNIGFTLVMQHLFASNSAECIPRRGRSYSY